MKKITVLYHTKQNEDQHWHQNTNNVKTQEATYLFFFFMIIQLLLNIVY